MRAELCSWVEVALGAPLRRHEPLVAEASHRRFFRVWSGGASLVVMESPPSLERNDAFVSVQRLLAGAGLPVPDIIALDLEAGFFILSDLGERSLEDAYRGPDRDQALEFAIGHLLRLQGIQAETVPAYEETRFRDELNIFVQWFLGGLLRQQPDAAMRPAFEALVANALAQPQCLIHRDYHCRNLLLDPEGRFGIVDFQDALIGPVTYDLACLLWDCYHYFDAAERRRWLRRYRSSAPATHPLAQSGLDESALTRALDLTALQRQFKAVGIFARLWLRDGKQTHLPHIAPVLDAMREVAALYRETQPLISCLEGLAADAAKAVQLARTGRAAP